ncbi:ABC transporter permease [Lacticaseibacillus zhaodongensis]|uniref:ABC transporter permease n=1 Tax=Lacticaseibacillus zhaodongensis TaxID=2668065 RepID=UPI0012D2DDCF|nr:ABC transporter permease [Lacticaseibacillus zhaodongensis]
MNFIKRAWLNLITRRGRSLLLVLVTSAIMLFVLAGILLRGAANTATQTAKDNVGATLTLSANRQAAFKKLRQGSSSGKPMGKMALNMQPVKISIAKQIAQLSNIAGYSVNVAASANASGFSAISSTSGSSGGPGGMPGASSRGDITISGVSSTASSSNFANDTYSITRGHGLTAKDAGTKHVVIESELAKQNNLNVGDTIKLKATSGSKKTYQATVIGIYKAKSSSTATAGPGASDPANTIFTAYAFANQLKGSKYAGTADSVTFTVSTPGKLSSVKKAANKLINRKTYVLNSDDASYKLVAQSMSSATSFANKIVWLVAIAGTIILALIVILMIRERRHEIGVLLALGEGRGKIIAQFFTELFIVLLVGVGIAGAGGKFVGDKLGAQVMSSQTASLTNLSTVTGGGQQGGPSAGGQVPGGRGGAPAGGQMNGAATQTAKLSAIKTHVTAKYLLELFAFGLLIILIAILAGAGGIFALQPRKILIE